MEIPADEWFVHKKIVCCERCEGSGVREWKEISDYHRGEYDVWKELCSFCDGEGRIIQHIYKTVVECILPNGAKEFKHLESKGMERLNGRKTSDFYKVGKE